MKAATLHQIKKEFESSTPKRIMELALRLIRYKTENKELISYLLFDESDVPGYISDLKTDLSAILQDINQLPPYQVKRCLRKALKFIGRYSKYTAMKETEAELLIHFCKVVKETGTLRYPNKMIASIYTKQVEKIEKMLPVLHEELQFDYTSIIRELKR
jgi:hypothetical protein